MKTKFVYTVVSSAKDVYALQAWVSILSLRHHNPDADVVIVCDRPTEKYLKTLPVCSLADEIIVLDLPESMSARERSRRLKTNLRSIVKGDFLYIDTDTVITRSLADIDGTADSICAVADSHCGNVGNPYSEMNRKNAAVLGYSLEGEKDFFNGGVVYAKDDDTAAAFYRKWNELYSECTKRGIFIDQTSYAKANIDLGHVMKELSGEWNCQLRHGAKYMKDARILHYLWTAKRAENPFVLGRQDVWDEIRTTGKIPEYVTELFDDPYSGIQNLTYLASSEETAFFNSRIFKVAYKFEKSAPACRSALLLCARILDAAYKLTHRS